MLCGGCSTSCTRWNQLRHASKVYGRVGSYTSTIAAPPWRVRARAVQTSTHTRGAATASTAPFHQLQPYIPEPATPPVLGAAALGGVRGRHGTFHKLGSISVKRSCPPVSKMCSSTLTSVSGMGTCLEQNSTPHVIWYVFGNFAPDELNICTRAVLPTAGSPACAARGARVTRRRAGRRLRDGPRTTITFVLTTFGIDLERGLERGLADDLARRAANGCPNYFQYTH